MIEWWTKNHTQIDYLAHDYQMSLRYLLHQKMWYPHILDGCWCLEQKMEGQKEYLHQSKNLDLNRNLREISYVYK
jgi:hypothetical protein